MTHYRNLGLSTFVFILLTFFIIFSTSVSAITLEEKEDLGLLTVNDRIQLDNNIITELKINEATITKTIKLEDVEVKNTFAKIEFYDKTDIDLNKIAITKNIIAVTGEENTKSRVTIYTEIPNTIIGIYKYSGITNNRADVINKGKLYTLVKTDSNGKASFRNTGFSTFTYSLPDPIFTGYTSERIKIYDFDYYVSNDYDTVFITLYNSSETITLLDVSYNALWKGGIWTSDSYVTDDYGIFLWENVNGTGFELELRTRGLNENVNITLELDLSIGNMSTNISFATQEEITWNIGDAPETEAPVGSPTIATTFEDTYYFIDNSTYQEHYFADFEVYFSNFTGSNIYIIDYQESVSTQLDNITTGSDDFDVYLSTSRFQLLTQDWENKTDLEINNQNGVNSEVGDIYTLYITAFNSGGSVIQNFNIEIVDEIPASGGLSYSAIFSETAEINDTPAEYGWTETGSPSYSDTQFYNGTKSLLLPTGSHAVETENAYGIPQTYNLSFWTYFESGTISTNQYWFFRLGQIGGTQVVFGLGNAGAVGSGNYIHFLGSTWVESSVTAPRDIWVEQKFWFNITGDEFEWYSNNTLVTSGAMASLADDDLQFITSNTQYPVYIDDLYIMNYTGVEIPATETSPQQIASFATPYTINGTGYLQLNLNNFFANYTNASFTFEDNIQSQTAYLETRKDGSTDLYDYDHLQVELNPTPTSILINIFGQNYDFSTIANISVWNEEGEASALINFSTLNYTDTPSEFPQQIASFESPNIIYYDTTEEYNFNNYFTNYTNISVTFTDDEEFQTGYLFAEINGTSDNYTYDHLVMSLYPTANYIALYIYAQDEEFNTTIILDVCNEAGCIDDSFAINITETPAVVTPTALSTWFGSIEDIFPDEEDLSLAQQMLYVILFMIATAIVLGIGVFVVKEEIIQKILMLGIGILLICEVFYFVAIGYIPITVLVLISLGASLIIYAIFRKATT